MNEEEEWELRPKQSSMKDMFDAQRSKAGFDTLYPEGIRKERLIPFVSRWLGPLPDAYDGIAAGIQMEMSNVLRSKALAILNHTGNGKEFDWTKVRKHPLIKELEDLTVAMGGGKGRKEGVEMSKGNPPMPTKSRWAWRRNDGR